MAEIGKQTKTLIQRLDVNGGNYAGVIISYGPNQVPDNHIVDPWLSGYLWGCGNAVCKNISGQDREYLSTDPRYHRFFSAGSDRKPDTPGTMVNDIVP